MQSIALEENKFVMFQPATVYQERLYFQRVGKQAPGMNRPRPQSAPATEAPKIKQDSHTGKRKYEAPPETRGEAPVPKRKHVQVIPMGLNPDGVKKAQEDEEEKEKVGGAEAMLENGERERMEYLYRNTVASMNAQKEAERRNIDLHDRFETSAQAQPKVKQRWNMIRAYTR